MDTLASTENAAFPSFYSWEVPGKPLIVQLSFAVIDAIRSDAIRALNSMPRRGAEIGGILLGSAARAAKIVVRIEDCVPVPCRYAFGPSYVLTGPEKQRFQDEVEAWAPSRGSLYAVGYYRSNTRNDLALTDEDLWLFSELFSDPSKVALLVRPRSTRTSFGGLFFWEDGRIRAESSYLEFPFDRAALGGAPPAQPDETPAPEPGLPLDPVDPEPVPAVEPAPVDAAADGQVPEAALPEPEPAAALEEPLGGGPPLPEAPAEAPAAAAGEIPLPSFLSAAGLGPERPPRKRIPLRRSLWIRIPVALLTVLAGVVLGYAGAQRLNLEIRQPVFRDPYALDLVVLEYGDNLHLTWDRNAPAIAHAKRGILVIGDGDQSRSMNLDAEQLRKASVIYRRMTNQVRFRLELFIGEKGSLSESWESASPASLQTQTSTPSPAPW